MKRISGSHYFLQLFTNSTLQHVQVTALSLYQFKLVCSVLQREYWEIYSSTAQNLKFDWSTQTMRKRKAAGKHKYLMKNNSKPNKYFSCFHFRQFLFIKQISKQPFARSSSKQVFFKILAKLTGQYLCRSFFLIGQNKTQTQLLSCEFCETCKNIIFTEQLRTTAPVLMEATYL